MNRIHIDCRHYTGSAPCAFHKRDARSCGRCGDYDPVCSRVLLIKLAAIGDVLRTTSLLPAIKRTWPGTHITWITDRDALPVLARHPLIDRVVASDACLPILLTERFDAACGLDAEPRSGALAALATCERRFGFITDEAGRVVPVDDAAETWWLMGLDDRRKATNRKTYQQLMHELCGLTGAADRPHFEIPAASRKRAEAFMRQDVLAGCRAVVGLNTGGGGRWAQKKWTAEGYEAFLALTRARHPDTAIVVLGGPVEQALNAGLLASGLEGVVDGGCWNSFADFAALVAAMDVLVTSDSLGLHAALAVKTPVVVFVGPTAPWELELYGDGAVVHAPDLPCIACYKSACDKPVTCMERLDPERVLEKLEEMLEVQRVQPLPRNPVILPVVTRPTPHGAVLPVEEDRVDRA